MVAAGGASQPPLAAARAGGAPGVDPRAGGAGARALDAYEQAMDQLSDLPDHARLRLLPVAPPLAPDEGAALAAAIAKLMRQFAREGRLARWAVEVLGDGALLAIATLGAEELSGCSQDKLAQLLAHHEQAGGRAIIAAPPIVIEISGQPRCLDRRQLRACAERGEVTMASVHWDVRVATLGDWRRAGRRPLGGSWLAALLPERSGPGSGT